MKSKEKTELNRNFTKLTQKRGISLIVLIVTIIVIIILAAAVILTVSKNNPVDSAKEAAFKEDVRSFQDELALSISKDYTAKAGQRDYKFNADKYTTGNEDDDSVYTYIPSFTKKYEGKFVIVNDELKYVGEEEKEITWSKDLGVKTKPVVPEDWKATIAEMTEDGVPIPIGFTYVTGTKETGTVIKDSLDNEFVWIPATESTYVKDLNFPKSCTPTGDDLPSSIADETADVKKYGGFYIGRYEAGIPTGDTAPSNKKGVPVSKQGATVWTDIDYTNAKASAESMINNNPYVQTGLLTGKAWDTTCHWIEDYIKTLNANSSLTNSTYYGNHYNSTFKYINSSNEEVEKKENSSVKIPAGSTEYTKTKNIYDLAGNVWEWTAEAGSTGRRIGRGGYYSVNGGDIPVSYREYSNHSNAFDRMGFRSRLYIK